ncbi:hypothetical protein LIER_22635 [Lithospermum erythrorhizon]|uniref:Uncharacterized protein n=1 Tax=Lithospermum erythrorhizon TaxID=34254 RepID=A0AAV3QX46_LITER
MNWEIRTRLSLMNFVTFHEILNAALHLELEPSEFQTIGEKRGREDLARFSGSTGLGFQGRPSQRSRFSQSWYNAFIANSRFSTVASVPRPFNRFGGSCGVIPGVRGNGGCFCYEVEFRGIVVDNLEVMELEGVELEVLKVVLLREVVRVVLELEEVKFTQSLSKKLMILLEW